MVHRTADARLLAGVLSAEGNHTKALTQLLDASATALAALSAYASAGSGPVSRAALAVTGHLRAADNALGKYAQACEDWRPELVQLKDVEEDVSSILRDRDILVTRLLKASNSNKPRPNSVTSPTASMTSIAGVGPKLAAAQTELQACEQALAAREAELDALRIRVVRDGLKARCKALVECAWTWGEMGKEGLRALEDSGPNGHVISPKYELPNEFFKPVPEGNLTLNRPSSDLSITPSLSASQTAVFSDTTINPSYQLTIPPPHAIGEEPLPPPKATMAAASRPTLDDKRRVSVVREEDEPEELPIEHPADHSDSEPTEEGPVQVIENDRFKTWNTPTASTSESGIAAKRSQTFPRLKLPSSSSAKANSSTSNNAKHATPPASPVKKDRERRSSTGPVGFFGKLFGRGSPKKKKAEEEGRWHTRTNANIGKARSRRDSASSDDSATPTGSRTVVVENRNRGNPWAELRAANRNAMDSPASEGRPLGRRLSKRRAELGADGRGGSAVHIPASPGLAPMVGHQRARSASAEPRRTTTLVESKSSPSPYVSRSTTPTPSNAPSNTAKTSKHGRRTQSVDLGRPTHTPVVPAPPAPKPAPLERRLSNSSARPSVTASNASKTAKHSSSPSTPSMPTEPPSLMSIVDGLSRQNREGWNSPASSSPLATARPLDPSPNITNLAPSRSGSKKYKRASLDVVPAHRSDGPGSGLGRSSSLRSGSGSNDDSVLGMHHPRKDAKPLKSALRQSSRTPSPMPPMDLIASPLDIGGLKTLGPPPERYGTADELVKTPRATVERPVVRSGMVEREDLAEDGGVESDSVESYATGQEDFDEADSPPIASAPLPAPSSAVLVSSLHTPTNGTGHGPASDISSGGSTAVGPPNVPPKDNDGRPVRRKSVRMSLTPQFAPTPPAVEGEGEMDWEHERNREAQPKRRNSTEKRRERAREKEREEAAEQERVQALEKEKEILAAQERERVRKQNEQEMGWKMRQHDKGPERDLWADSSEDGGSDAGEDYKTARSLLLKAGKV